MSTLGLDGVLPWAQARQVAAASARSLPATPARLDEAAGSQLATDLVTVQDDPPADSARWAGVAVCGEGPWRLSDLDALTPGWGRQLGAGQPIPRHCDAVIRLDLVQFRERDGGRGDIRDDLEAVALDRLTHLPDDRARPDLGEGIVRQAVVSAAGHVLLTAGTPVTPAVLSVAAANGHDELTVVRPPVVGVLVLGGSLLDRGLPRYGRVRDALGHTVPAFVGALGARGNPAVRAPDTTELLLHEIDDAQVDVLITTGSTAPGPDNHLRTVLGDLGAHWLVDGVSATPGAQMLLARLPDGRFLIGLPGDPPAALAGLVTLATPLIRSLRGVTDAARPRSAVLLDDVVPADYADDTALVPVQLDVSTAGTLARPLPPKELASWARADAIVVAPPGTGYRGDVLDLLDPLGRAAPDAPC